METILFWLFALIAGLWIFGVVMAVKAREQVSISTDLSRAEARDIIERSFGRLLWKNVSGPGEVNKQRRVAKGEGPVLSIDLEHRPGGVEVQIWMSSWQSLWGMALGGEFAYFQKKKLLRRFDAVPVEANELPAA